MNTPIDFARCLDYLLSTLGLSINRLAKALNVDNSLVNRWVNGKRIPSYSSNHIESIAKYLAAHIKNSLQIQSINELFEKVFDTNSNDVTDNEEKIKQILFETQGISLNNQKQLQKKSETLLKHKNPPLKDISDVHALAPPTLNEVINLSQEDKVIIGTRNITSACCHLFELALQTLLKSNKIYITHFNDAYLYISTDINIPNYQDYLLNLMTRGWEIHYILRIDYNVKRTIDFLNFLKPLIGTDRLHIYYIYNYDSLAFGKDYIIVPGIGALSCFFTQTNMNCALYLRNSMAVSLYEDYLDGLTKYYAKPLFNKYSKETDEMFIKCYTDCEDAIGNRFIYEDYFSVLTLPPYLYKKILSRIKLSKEEMEISLGTYHKRLEAFQSNIKLYEYKDIYTLDSLNNLLKNRQFFLYDHTGTYPIQLEVEELIDFLLNIINLLDTYENYHIAFIKKNKFTPGFKKHLYCLIKERHAALLEIFDPTIRTPEVRLSIKEPMIISAFEESFKILWQQTAPVMKEKTEIIAWLQRETDLLKAVYA